MNRTGSDKVAFCPGQTGVAPPSVSRRLHRYRMNVIERRRYLDFLGAWRRTLVTTRGFLIKRKDCYGVSVLDEQSPGHVEGFDQSCSAKIKIKNTNHASGQDKVENGDLISS